MTEWNNSFWSSFEATGDWDWCMQQFIDFLDNWTGLESHDTFDARWTWSLLAN